MVQFQHIADVFFNNEVNLIIHMSQHGSVITYGFKWEKNSKELCVTIKDKFYKLAFCFLSDKIPPSSVVEKKTVWTIAN